MERCNRRFFSAYRQSETVASGNCRPGLRLHQYILTVRSSFADQFWVNSAGFWCIWGFWTGERSLADRIPTGHEAQMPYFRPFSVSDESDRPRVCGRRRAVVRRCTRTKKIEILLERLRAPAQGGTIPRTRIRELRAEG